MIRIKELRLEKGMNMRQTAIALGIPYTTYISYEKGEREPNSEMLIILADYFNCSVDYLIGRSDERIDESVLDKVNEIENDYLEATGNIYHAKMLSSIKNIIPLPETKEIPLLGTIACGEPILAEENIEEYIKADKDINAEFALRCKGDSMIEARINNGDIVYIHQQPDVENGEIAAVLIGDEATLKRVYKYPEKGMLVLKPANPKYDDFIFVGEELETIKILGKAVGFYSSII